MSKKRSKLVHAVLDRLGKKNRVAIESALSQKPARPFLVARNPLDEMPATNGGPFIGYTRWIPEHSDILISRLVEGCPRLVFRDIRLFAGQSVPETRHAIGRLAENEPVRFRRIVLACLLQLKARGMRAMLLTLDWTPALRELAFACRTLGILTILIPHENGFSSEESYYRHRKRGTNLPAADYVLCWGELQRDIFVRRGYPADRIVAIGSPKLDADVSYRPTLSNGLFRNVFGLPAEGRIVLFAMQPMDSYPDQAKARAIQARAIADILDYCEARGCSLLVRTPPSRDRVIPPDLQERLDRSPQVAIDEAGEYVFTPEETIAQADLVVSINSTMLFEARLMGTPSLSLRYADPDSMWDKAEVDFATDREAAFAAADRMLAAGGMGLSQAGHAWASANFSDRRYGFDGHSTGRIEEALLPLLEAAGTQSPFDYPGSGNIAAIRPNVVAVSTGVARRFPATDLSILLGAERIIMPEDEKSAAAADLYVTLRGESDPQMQRWRRLLGRPTSELAVGELS